MTPVFESFLIFDRGIFFFFQRLQRPWLDYLLAWPTHLGDTAVALALTVILILAANKKKGVLKIPAAVFALFLTEWTGDFLKRYFARPRPFTAWENIHVIFYKPTNYAFPSGHAAIAFASAYLVTHFCPKWGRYAYGAAVWVCLTRLYVGVHYPSDLVAGAVLGSGIAALSCLILKPVEKFGKTT